MKNQIELKPCIVEAICQIEDYILNVTGKKPTQEELSSALTKFFVLKEIREFIEMNRLEGKQDPT